MKLLHDDDPESNPSQKRNHQLVEVKQLRERVLVQTQEYHNKMKATFDRHANTRDILVGDYVLKQDARRENKGQHGMFSNLWLGPFLITKVQGNKTYQIATKNGEQLGNPLNGRFLKLFFKY